VRSRRVLEGGLAAALRRESGRRASGVRGRDGHQHLTHSDLWVGVQRPESVLPSADSPGQRCPPGCPHDELPAAPRTDGTEDLRVATEAARADEGQQERSTQD